MPVAGTLGEKEHVCSRSCRVLMQVQQADMKSVNEALNGIYIEEEDYSKLNASVSNYTNFDQLELATTLQKHELLEMRRVAGTLYNKVSQLALLLAPEKIIPKLSTAR